MEQLVTNGVNLPYFNAVSHKIYFPALVPGAVSKDVEYTRSAGGPQDTSDSIPPLSASISVPAYLVAEKYKHLE